MRIDVDKLAAARPYGTEGQPVVGREGARPEIWAYGLRNVAHESIVRTAIFGPLMWAVFGRVNLI